MSKVQLNIRVESEVFDDIAEIARRKGITRSAAAEEVVISGLSASGTVDVLNKFLLENNKTLVEAICREQQKQIDKLQKQVDRIGKDLSIIKKNERYGDRAALGLLAWASWVTQYFDLMMDSAKDEMATYDAGQAMFDVGITKTHKIFWDAGGKLCRDPEAIMHSYLQMGDIIGDEQMKQITGMTSREWRAHVGYTDSDAISKLADKTNKKGE